MIYSLSHTDLDGYSCTLLLQKLYSIKRWNVTYNRISEILYSIRNTLFNENDLPKVFFITDLSFSEDDLIELEKIVQRFNEIKFIYIDHHNYDDKLMKIFDRLNTHDNFKYIIEQKKSATKLLFEVLEKNLRKKVDAQKFKEIKLYVEIVNAYDIWLTDSKYFQIGVDLNNYFWEIQYKRFLYEFKNFNILDTKWKQSAKQIRQNAEKHFKNLEEKSLSFEDNGVRVIYTDDHQGMVNIIYKDTPFLIYATSYGRFSIRINKKKITEDLALKIKENVISAFEYSPHYLNGGGHTFAFGLTFDDSVKNNHNLIISILRDIYKVINEVTNEVIYEEQEEIPF